MSPASIDGIATAATTSNCRRSFSALSIEAETSIATHTRPNDPTLQKSFRQTRREHRNNVRNKTTRSPSPPSSSESATPGSATKRHKTRPVTDPEKFTFAAVLNITSIFRKTESIDASAATRPTSKALKSALKSDYRAHVFEEHAHSSTNDAACECTFLNMGKDGEDHWIGRKRIGGQHPDRCPGWYIRCKG